MNADNAEHTKATHIGYFRQNDRFIGDYCCGTAAGVGTMRGEVDA